MRAETIFAIYRGLLYGIVTGLVLCFLFVALDAGFGWGSFRRTSALSGDRTGKQEEFFSALT